jgi:hypothetical protein
LHQTGAPVFFREEQKAVDKELPMHVVKQGAEKRHLLALGAGRIFSRALCIFKANSSVSL